MAENKLYRSETDRMLGGVCGGIAEVYGHDPSLIRIVTFLIVAMTFPVGLIGYLLAWLIIPNESEIRNLKN